MQTYVGSFVPGNLTQLELTMSVSSDGILPLPMQKPVSTVGNLRLRVKDLSSCEWEKGEFH